MLVWTLAPHAREIVATGGLWAGLFQAAKIAGGIALSPSGLWVVALGMVLYVLGWVASSQMSRCFSTFWYEVSAELLREDAVTGIGEAERGHDPSSGA
jgi:hypothetical protein